MLDAGINVYTTLNVQHWESLNDVVAQITGVVIRETVPDTFLRRAHELELVDLAPGSTVHSNADTRSLGAGGGGRAQTILLRIDSAGGAVNDFIVELLRVAARSTPGLIASLS